MTAYQGTGDEPSAARFEPFDLTVNLGPDAIPWLSAVSRVGSVHGIPRSGAALLPLEDLLDLVNDYTDAVRFAEWQPDPELSRYFEHLVFGEPRVLQLFQATRGVAADRGRQVLFRILAAPHLATLPWELLPDPAAAQRRHAYRYLALAPDTHLVRMARAATYPARPMLLEAPLNLLLVLSSPTPTSLSEDWLAFDIFEIKRALLAELAPLVETGMLNVVVEDRPTLDNLRRRIGEQKRGYHLFHYVGHALPNGLILEDRVGQRKDLEGSQFVELLRLCPDLRLAVFAGCETARAPGDPAILDVRKPVEWRELVSLADFCVQEACPAVVGMQAVLPFTTERVFTRFFYQALVHGYSTAEALRLARGAIQGDERVGGPLLDWSVPTLFVGSNEPGPLLPRTAAPPTLPARARAELKLGLRQSDARFYGRELQLRQAVDILARVASERVLVVSGAAGVGKTELVDRALEELGSAASHVLYVHIGRLAPEVMRAAELLDVDDIPDLKALRQVEPDVSLDRLCRLVTEVLRDGATSVRDATWTISEWWERRVESLVQCEFVLVIDDVDLIDAVQRRLLERLIERWLKKSADAALQNNPPAQVLADFQEQLSQWQDRQESDTWSWQADQAFWQELPTELQSILTGLPDRLFVEACRVLSDAIERLVWDLNDAAMQAASNEPIHSVAPDEPDFERHDVIQAVLQLEHVRSSLGNALELLAERRSPVRIALAADARPQQFVKLSRERLFDMRLAPLAWPETWWWIRRNLPGLLSFGETYLSRLWLRLGPRLDQWEELERLVLRARNEQADGTVDLIKLVDRIAPLPSVQGEPRRALPARRGERPLRLAVAGPHLSSAQDVCEAITRLAIEHGISGRVAQGAERNGALATLLDEPSPFLEQTALVWPELLEWLRRVSARAPDIVLLDYGGPSPYDEFVTTRDAWPDRDLVRSLHYGSLLIAAGGNKMSQARSVTRPSAYPEVLGVGPLDDQNQLRSYAEWTPDLCKPDLFMADDLAASALVVALKPGLAAYHASEGTWGSSFAALRAVATATLVWSILPELSPRGIKSVLSQASKPILGAEPARSLTMHDAVRLAQRRAIIRRLEEGPAPLQTLSVMTGLDTQTLAPLLEDMVREGPAPDAKRVVKLTSSRLERYELR